MLVMAASTFFDKGLLHVDSLEGAHKTLQPILGSASSALFPLIPAGSDGGPTTMKSLCITKSRRSPFPSFMNCTSSDAACTSTTSASPRAPIARAAPVPTALVFTL